MRLQHNHEQTWWVEAAIMEVKEQPLTLVADKVQREIALLAPGLRVTMTGAEALALWTELGNMLKAVYATRPETSAATLGALRERSSSPSALILPKQVAVDRLIKGMIAHAQRLDAAEGTLPQSSRTPNATRGVAGVSSAPRPS